ncbi:MAG: hypothetical protein DELT_02505 [Desulfovibrio sp.]
MRFSAHAGTFIICCAVLLLGTGVYQRVANPALHYHLDAPQPASPANPANPANHDHPPLSPEDAQMVGKLMESLRAEPDDTGLAMQIADIFVRNGDWINAEGFLDRITQRAPENHRAWHLLGYTRSQQGFYAKAAEAFEKAVAVSAEPQSMFSLAVMYRYHLNMPQKALPLFTAVADSPKSDDSLRAQAAKELAGIPRPQ